MSKIKIIGKNISFMGLNQIVAVIISFLLFPFIVKHVEKEIYGVYLLVVTITGYFGFMDFGVMTALTKYVSEYIGKKDIKGINTIIDASFSFYVLVGIIISLLLFICSNYCHYFFKIGSHNIEIARYLFLITSIFSLFIWPMSTFQGIVQGLSLWNVYAIIMILTQILTALIAFYLFSSGFGIISFFIVTQSLRILGYFIFYYVSKNKIDFKIIFPYFDFRTFKFIFNFSFFIFLGSLVNIFIFQIHNIIIGHFISMSAITIYAVAYNIQNYFRRINATIGGPVWTMASQMEGSGDYEAQRKLLFSGTKYMSAVFLPIVLIMFFFAEPFINYWMGPGFHKSILPARIIILFWLFNGTLEIGGGMLSAKGIVRRPFFIRAAVAILNIIIGISLIKFLGITAIALGLTISMVLLGFPLILRLSLKSLKVKFREYFNEAIAKNLCLYFMVIVLSLIFLKYLYPVNLYFTLFGMAVIYFVSLILYYLFILNKIEKAEIIKLSRVESIYNRLFSIN